MCLVFILLLRDLDALCGVDVYVDVDVIYKYLCPLCFLNPYNQEGILFSMITYVLHPSCVCVLCTLCIVDVFEFII